MKYIDLHTHTTASDGTYTPCEIIDYAIEKKLAAIAITDHDTISGIPIAKNHLYNTYKEEDLEIISGIEFSTNSSLCEKDLHIIGLYVDENNTDFVAYLNSIITSRNIRNSKMITSLQRIGLNITLKDVVSTSNNDTVITRAHFAKALLKKGYINNIREAFDKYIGNGCNAYVKREKVHPKDIIELILACGGIPILAHPTLYELNLKELDTLLEKLKCYGLMGIEGMYSLYTKSEEKYIKDFADKYDLLISGGSDFHGTNKNGIDLGSGRGNLKIPYSFLEIIKKAISE
jgi:predicted metal-dependent phosphoesterase TrpH